MTAAGSLDRGRVAFGRQAWGDAYAQLTAADREAALEPEGPRAARDRRSTDRVLNGSRANRGRVGGPALLLVFFLSTLARPRHPQTILSP